MQYSVGAFLQVLPSSVALQWRSLGRVQPVSIPTVDSDTPQHSLHSIVCMMYNLFIYATVAIPVQLCTSSVDRQGKSNPVVVISLDRATRQISNVVTVV